MWKVSYYILGDLIRNKVILGYLILLSIVSWGIFYLESQPEKGLLILIQVTIMSLPLVVMVFATIYYYNSLEFIILILAQPVARSTVIKSLYLGLASSFSLSFILGLGFPLVVYYPTTESLLLVISGVLLTWIFIAVALLISTLIRDKSKGMGLTLIIWAFFSFLFDGFLLYFMYQFGDYPIEKVILGLTMFNPIDVARILVIMKTEASAMLGLSGAVFTRFFESYSGLSIAFGVLILWIAVPFFLARARFLKKDM